MTINDLSNCVLVVSLVVGLAASSLAAEEPGGRPSTSSDRERATHVKYLTPEEAAAFSREASSRAATQSVAPRVDALKSLFPEEHAAILRRVGAGEPVVALRASLGLVDKARRQLEGSKEPRDARGDRQAFQEAWMLACYVASQSRTPEGARVLQEKWDSDLKHKTTVALQLGTPSPFSGGSTLTPSGTGTGTAASMRRRLLSPPRNMWSINCASRERPL